SHARTRRPPLASATETAGGSVVLVSTFMLPFSQLNPAGTSLHRAVESPRQYRRHAQGVEVHRRSAAASSVRALWTAPTEMPTPAAITLIDSPRSRLERIAARLSSSITRGRPPTLPRLRAASSPFLVLRTM